jgi:ATP-binding cassette, subfamily F, member 3
MKGATPRGARAARPVRLFRAEGGTEGRQAVGRRAARLALALITRDAPHLLILDEPTNHLDVDAREALVQALNEYEGAVVMVSHDRHMIEMPPTGWCWWMRRSLTAASTIIPMPYWAGRRRARPGGPVATRRRTARLRPRRGKRVQALRKAAKAAEAEIARLTARRADIDLALFDPEAAAAADRKRTASELMQERGQVERALEAAEQVWLEACEALETAGV